MAGSKTNYLAKALTDHWLGNTAYTAPVTLYIGLATAAANAEAGTFTEVPTATWTNYARVAKTNNTTNFANTALADPYSKTNANLVDFGTVTATGSVVVTHAFLADALTGGNILMWADLTSSKTISNGDTVSFAIGALVFTED